MTPRSSPAPTARTGLLREARLSRDALDANISSLLRTRNATDVVVDVRADAYGHGLSAVIRMAAEHGIRRFRVSPDATLPSGLRAEEGAIDAEFELCAYGFAPRLADIDLRPVSSLIAEVVSVKHVPAGSAVSYGYTYRTHRDGVIALVGLGYADGLPRLGSNAAHAVVGGAHGVVAGRIAMDQFVLDLGSNVTVSVGDEVTIWGAGENGDLTLRDWAAIARRPPQDITAGLGARVRRPWRGGASS